MMTYPNMWGFGNCARIPSLPDYARAKKHFEDTAPIRGRNPEVRPLGSVRRYAWYRIKENKRVIEDGFLGQYITTYSCELYGMDCVEFYPDGSITIYTRGYHSPTTMAFINYTTKEFGYIESVGGKWYWKQKGIAFTDDGNKGKMFLISKQRDSKIILKPDADGNMIVDNPVAEKKYAVSRKAMNEVRKKYEFFHDYCRVMLSMNPNSSREEHENVVKQTNIPNPNYAVAYYESARRDRDMFFAKLDEVIEHGDVELMYALALSASYAFGRWNYRDSSNTCTPEVFTAKWNETLKYQFFDKVMVANDVEAGVGFKDHNTKYK